MFARKQCILFFKGRYDHRGSNCNLSNYKLTRKKFGDFNWIRTRSLCSLALQCSNQWSYENPYIGSRAICWVHLIGTGSRLSACSLIKILFSNLLLILSVNNPAHMYLSDLRVYFKVEGYFRVTWSRMEESPQLVSHCAWAIRPETLIKFIIIIIIKIAEKISGLCPHYQRWI